MKKALLAITLLILCAGCSEVEEIAPLLYPGGDISDPSATTPQFQPKAPIPAPPPFSGRPPSDREVSQALEKEGLAALGLSPELLHALGQTGSITVDLLESSPPATYQAAYARIFQRGWPLVWTADWTSERFCTMYGFVSENLELRQVTPLLQRMLQEMIHASLEQYHYSAGDLKEAAWRNTAFLCVAARLLNPNAPTPFIVSGIVRQELDLIQAAAGEEPSPLFSLDAKENPCAGGPAFGCIDYGLFRNHPFIQFHPSRRKLHQALLWLSTGSLPLQERLPFLQAVLLTDCVKRAQVKEDDRQVPAWRAWLKILRFYAFFYRLEPSTDFVQVDRLLRGSLPEGFDENFFLNPSKIQDLERAQPEFTRLREEEFRLFPSPVGNLTPYFSPLVFPSVGPDTKNPLYANFLLPNLSADCTPAPPDKSRRRYLNCGGLTEEDYRYLFCNSANLAFQDPRVMDIFRPLPSATDLAAALDWPAATPAPGFCGYSRNLARLQRQLRNRPANDWAATLADLMVWTMRHVPEVRPTAKPRDVSIPALPPAAPPFGMLVQIQPGPVAFRESRSTPDRNRSLLHVRLEAAPESFHRLSEMTEYFRHYLMMSDYSDLLLDEILLQYSSVADRLAQLAVIPSAADATSPAQLQYLQSLDQRLDLLESRLLGYFPGDSPARFQRTFPRWSPLWVSAETRTQRIGICGEFRWRITLFRNGAGLHAGVAPLPAYLEMEASISRFFSQPEIAELLRKGVPKPPVD